MGDQTEMFCIIRDLILLIISSTPHENAHKQNKHLQMIKLNRNQPQQQQQ